MARSLVLPPSRTGVQGPVADLFAQWAGILNKLVLARLEGYTSVYETGATGDGTSDDRGRIADADTKAQAKDEGLVFQRGTFYVASDLTITSSVRLLKGAVIKPANGVTVTLNGAFEGDVSQHFDLSLGGTIAFGSATVEKVFPQWWGAVGDGTNDDTDAIQAATDAIGDAGGGIVFFIPGEYKTTSAITLTNSGVRLVGGGRQNTVIQYNGTGKCFTLGTTASPIFRWGISNMRIRDEGGTGTHAAYLEYAREGEMRNVEIRGNGSSTGWTTAGIYLAGTTDKGSWTNRFDWVQIVSTSGDGVFLADQSNAVFFHKCHFTLCGNDGVRIHHANGCHFVQCQFEQAGSGYEIHIAGSGASGRALGVSVNNCYFELKADTTGARALLVDEADSELNTVEGLSFSHNFVWGTENAEYGVELNNPNGACFGLMIGNLFHGVTTAGIKATAGNDRVIAMGVRALSGFGGGTSKPLLDDNSGASGSSAILAELRGIEFSGQLQLPRYTGSPTSIIGEGSFWYSTSNDRPLFRDGNSNTVHLQDVRAGSTGNRPTSRPTGWRYFDTSLGRPIWWSGAAWVDATGTSV